MAKNPNRIKEPLFDRVFYIVTFIILLAILVIIISSSLSSILCGSS